MDTSPLFVNGKLTTYFFNSRCFTAKFTKIIQLRTTHFTTASHFDFIDFRGMKRESSFHAYTVRNFTNRKSFANSAATTLNHNTFEQLDTFTRSLDNLNVHFQSVTRTKARNILAKLFLRNRLYDIHLGLPPSTQVFMPLPKNLLFFFIIRSGPPNSQQKEFYHIWPYIATFFNALYGRGGPVERLFFYYNITLLAELLSITQKTVYSTSSLLSKFNIAWALSARVVLDFGANFPLPCPFMSPRATASFTSLTAHLEICV